MDSKPWSAARPAAMQLATAPAFRLGPLSIDPPARKLSAGEHSEMVEPRVMRVLVALANEAGEVHSRDELIELCWDGQIVSDNAINRVISVLRRALGDLSGDSVRIETIAKVGFRLVADTPLAESEDEAPSAPTALASGTNDTAGQARTLNLRSHPAWIAGLAALILAVAAIWYFSIRDVPSAKSLSVAVLPFDAESGGADDQAYARSISSALAEGIGHEALEVLSPTQSFRYTGSSKPSAYDDLETTYIIDGSVRRDKGMVIATVHFDNRATREALFSKAFEVPEADSVLLARQVANTMSNRVGGLSKIDPSRPDQAREMMAFADASSVGDARTAHSISQKLASAAPDWGKLQAFYAATTAYMVRVVPFEERRARYDEAVQLVEEVGRKWPREGELFLARLNLTPDSDWSAREALMRESLRANPSDAQLRFNLGVLLLQAGYIVEAAGHLRTAQDAMPNNYWVFHDLLTAYALNANLGPYAWDDLMERNQGLAGNIVQKTMLFSARFGFALEMENYDKAQAEIDAREHMFASRYAGLSALIRARKTGQPADIAAALERCRRSDAYHAVEALCAPLLIENGEADLGFAHLYLHYPDLRGKTREQREDAWFRSLDDGMARFRRPTLYSRWNQAVRAHPSFAELADRLGLLDYWRKKGPPDFCKTENAPVCAMIEARKPGSKI